MKKYKSILFISDPHYPYNHPDILSFLREIKKTYKPDKIVFSGDELDHHAASFHEHNQDLYSHGHEMAEAIKRMQPLYKLFPEADLLDSNHGSMAFRRAIYGNLSAKVIRPYREQISAPKGWHWHDELILYASNDQPIYFCHGKSSDVLKVSQSMGMNVCQGHFHEKFELRYWGNKLGLFWGLTAGCLIENSSLAFAYNKVNLKRPVIGCAVILDGLPKLLPMVLNKNGRWIGVVP